MLLLLFAAAACILVHQGIIRCSPAKNTKEGTVVEHSNEFVAVRRKTSPRTLLEKDQEILKAENKFIGHEKRQKTVHGAAAQSNRQPDTRATRKLGDAPLPLPPSESPFDTELPTIIPTKGSSTNQAATTTEMTAGTMRPPSKAPIKQLATATETVTVYRPPSKSPIKQTRH